MTSRDEPMPYGGCIIVFIVYSFTLVCAYAAGATWGLPRWLP